MSERFPLKCKGCRGYGWNPGPRQERVTCPECGGGRLADPSDRESRMAVELLIADGTLVRADYDLAVETVRRLLDAGGYV